MFSYDFLININIDMQNTNQNKNDERIIKKRLQEETLQRLYHKSEEEQATALAKKFNLGYIDLNILSLDPEVVNAIPEEEAKEANLAAVYKVGKKYQIAVTDPESYETKKLLKKLQKENGIEYRLVVVSSASLRKAWKNYEYKTMTETFENQSILLKEKDLTEFERGISNLIELKKRIAEINTTEVFNIIIAGALKTNSSDIHIEPGVNRIRLRYRIDGVLQDIINFPKNINKTIISRVKMLSKMKLNITDTPQDGHFTIKMDNDNVNVRTSILPTNNGESIVMRILSENITGLGLDELGLNQYYLEKLEEEIEKPTGMILATGPTGSGKTTTLYSFISRLNKSDVKIITLENPIEYRIEGISQTEVSDESEFGFAEGIKAIVRQDPDIVMVGEIRDSQTAETAIQAALTGHLVLSTLHTNNAASAIPRLLHLNVIPSLIAPAVNAIIAQRLIRKLCNHCKEEYLPAQETVEKIEKILSRIPKNDVMEFPKEIKTIYRSHGCSKCNFIGYSGRIGIYEVFTLTPEIEKLIVKGTSSSEITVVARKEGMIEMQEDGILKALKGITSLEEVRRVTGEIFGGISFSK